MPVEPRRQLNGKYRIKMDEDILQAILLHYVGVSWSVHFKSEFKYLIYRDEVWVKADPMFREDCDR